MCTSLTLNICKLHEDVLTAGLEAGEKKCQYPLDLLTFVTSHLL